MLRLERRLLAAAEGRLTHDETDAASVRHATRTYLRLRHAALYGLLKRRRLSVGSTWKMVLAATLRRGDVAVDAGANLGRVAQAAAWLVGRRGRVHAFEPSPRIASLLQRRAHLLGLDQITLDRRALGARSGSAILYEHDEGHGGSSSLSPTAARDRPDRETEITVVTLDEYDTERPLEGLRLLKVDVEGSEVAVLTGARAVIARERPVLLVEASPVTLAPFGAGPDDIRRGLTDLGYEVFKWERRQLEALELEGDTYAPPPRRHHEDFIALAPRVHDDVRQWLEGASRRLG